MDRTSLFGVKNTANKASSFTGISRWWLGACWKPGARERDNGGDGGRLMNKKHEALRSPQLFYAFVDFGELTDPKRDPCHHHITPRPKRQEPDPKTWPFSVALISFTQVEGGQAAGGGMLLPRSH